MTTPMLDFKNSTILPRRTNFLMMVEVAASVAAGNNTVAKVREDLTTGLTSKTSAQDYTVCAAYIGLIEDTGERDNNGGRIYRVTALGQEVLAADKFMKGRLLKAAVAATPIVRLAEADYDAAMEAYRCGREVTEATELMYTRYIDGFLHFATYGDLYSKYFNPAVRSYTHSKAASSDKVFSLCSTHFIELPLSGICDYC